MFTWAYVVVAAHEMECLKAIRERLSEVERLHLFAEPDTTFEKFLVSQLYSLHFDLEFWTRSVARIHRDRTLDTPPHLP